MDFPSDSENCSFDELFDAEGCARPHGTAIVDRLRTLSADELVVRQQAADAYLHDLGITFNVYGDSDGTERVWPFDVVPRVIDSSEWETIAAGLRQRIIALNLFVDDVYNARNILKQGVISEDLVLSSKTYRPQCVGLKPRNQAWCQIAGTDLVRDKDGEFYVLEDNLRCPSGVSYVLANRELMKRTFADVFQGLSVSPIEEYAENLLRTLLDSAPTHCDQPTAVLLTPGIYNSAYFEHTFLAQQMGIELVEGRDLVVLDDHVYMKTTQGLHQVDVIYRRIDDDFLDPESFRKDSTLGVANLMTAYRRGNVTIANAPGTGIADDKAIYAYVPDFIRFYLDEEPILNNVPTYLCEDESQRKHVLANLKELVVKPTNESGGYGILMGPQSTHKERLECAAAIQSNPRDWIAQPMLQLSTVPTIVDRRLCPRHVDLRPFVLHSKDTYVLPGGLTRVALEEGSMVVNSSQGGGSKDTWVLHLARDQANESRHVRVVAKEGTC